MDRAVLRVEYQTKGVAQSERELRQFEATAASATATVKAGTAATSQLGASFGTAGARLTAFASRMSGVEQSLRRTGRSLTASVTLPIAAIGALSVRTAANFETAMNRVRALTGATGEQFEALEAQARELGATTQFSASQAAGAMGFLAQAGFSTEKIMSSMTGTLNLAAASQLDLARTADIVSNVMQGFRIEAGDLDDAVDVLTATFSSSNTNLEQLGEAMSYVAPIASALGASFEETAAAVGILSNAGIQGSRAGTGLQRVLGILTEQSDRLGITLRDTAGNMLPLADILQQLERRGLSAEEIMSVFGQRAGPAMAVLLSTGSDALREFTADLEASGGTAERIAEIQMEGLNGELKRLRSILEEAGIEIGNAMIPAVQSLSEWVRGLTTWFTELTDQQQALVLKFAAIAAAIGPLLLVGSRVIRLIRSMGTALTFLAANPVAAAVIAIGLLAAGIWALVEAGDAWIDKQHQMGQRRAAEFDQTRIDALAAAESINDLGAGFAGMTEEVFAAAKATENYAATLGVLQEIQDVTNQIRELENQTSETSAQMITAERAIEALQQPLTDSGNWWEGASSEAERFQQALRIITNESGIVNQDIRELANAEQLAAISAAIQARDTDALVTALQGLSGETQQLIQLRERLALLQSGQTIPELPAGGEGGTGSPPTGTDAANALRAWEEWWEEVTGVAVDDGPGRGRRAALAYIEGVNRELEANRTIAEALGEEWDPTEYLEQQIETIRSTIATLLSIPEEEIDSVFRTSDQSISALLDRLRALQSELEDITDDEMSLIESFQLQIDGIDRLAATYEQLGIEYDAAEAKSNLVSAAIERLATDAEITDAEFQTFIDTFEELLIVADDTAKVFAKVADGSESMTQTFEEQLAVVDQMATVYAQLGVEYDAAAERQRLFFNELNTAIAQGLPADKIADFVAQYRDLLVVGEEVEQSPLDEFLFNIATGLTDDIDKAKELQEAFHGVYESIISLVSGGGLSAIEAFGEALGEGASFGEAMSAGIVSFARAVLGALPQILLSIGTAILQANPALWPLALGFIAASGVVSGLGGYVAGRETALNESAKGNVFQNGSVTPFASGTIVTTPTFFPMANGGTGLMGEAGPEGVLPLTRLPDGNLGVEATDSGGANVNLNVNVENYSNEEVAVEKDEETGDIRVIVGQVVRQAYADGELDSTMQDRYGVQTRGVR